jgi:MFS family permease
MIPSQAAAPPTEKRVILLVTCLSSFLTPFVGSAVNVALPAIGAEFNMNAISLGWVATSYLLAAAIFLVPFGRLADITGRKKIFSMGVFIFTISTLLSAVSVSGPMLIAARILQGLGSSMIFGTGMAILTAAYPPGERGAALGINTAATYTGLSLGPVLG